MNRINPIYFLLLCFMVVIMSFSILSDSKNELIQKNEKKLAFEQTVHTYLGLKKGWFEKIETQQQIKYILNDFTFKKAKISSTIQNKKAIIKLKTKDKKTIKQFVNKLLNKKLLINKLDISKTTVIVEVSIK